MSIRKSRLRPAKFSTPGAKEFCNTIFMTPETAKGLSLIDKGRLVEEAGAPAYVVMGNVDVKNFIHAPLDDADKNLPTEAAAGFDHWYEGFMTTKLPSPQVKSQWFSSDLAS